MPQAPVRPIGQLSGTRTGSIIPIYSVDDSIILKRGQNWDLSFTQRDAVNMTYWKHSEEITFPVQFELNVGWGDVQSEDDLVRYVRWFHSWSSTGVNGERATSPQIVRYILKGYINSKGVLRDVETALKAPWDQSGGNIRPRRVSFSGTFVCVPGIEDGPDGVKVIASKQNQLLADTQIQTRLYEF